MEHWIRVRTDLFSDDDFKMMNLVAKLREKRVVAYGCVVRVWALAEKTPKLLPPTEDGESDAIIEHSPEAIDAIVETPGFCRAMVEVGWMRIEGGQVIIPKFTRHMGKLERKIKERERACEYMKAKREVENPKPSDQPKAAPRVSSKVIAAIYQAYPRKLGRQKAFPAIEKAITLLRDPKLQPPPDHDPDQPWPPSRPERWLIDRVKLFAASAAAQEPEFIPYPTTWFTQGRYFDDAKQWHIIKAKFRSKSDERREAERAGDHPEPQYTVAKL